MTVSYPVPPPELKHIQNLRLPQQWYYKREQTLIKVAEFWVGILALGAQEMNCYKESAHYLSDILKKWYYIALLKLDLSGMLLLFQTCDRYWAWEHCTLSLEWQQRADAYWALSIWGITLSSHE